uniref:WD40-like Beta Propeller Repeat n=1 Tax=Candidatus Kentrum sp. FW TaxID=2126338 RepID=A0A450TAK9_9GAMM|nr:MAG: hypothetical protein BECKFW1821B_GA0114236_108613 [Candidatus Kentron sp. FW]
MWYHVVTIKQADFGTIHAVWIAPDGAELLLLTRERTLCWSVREGVVLWSIQEKAGGDSISPDGRIYRDLASGLFYPVLGSHGGQQSRTHPSGGSIHVPDESGPVTVTDPTGATHSLPQALSQVPSHQDYSNDWRPGDWRVATFSESGDHILIAGPRSLAVYTSLPPRK